MPKRPVPVLESTIPRANPIAIRRRHAGVHSSMSGAGRRRSKECQPQPARRGFEIAIERTPGQYHRIGEMTFVTPKGRIVRHCFSLKLKASQR